MSPYFRSDKFYFLSVVLVAIILCYVGLGAYPIYILDEAKNAEAAREIWENGNWFLPTFNNELRTDKPPLHYFFMGLAYEMFGVSSFSARFFSAFFGVLTIIFTYHYTKKFYNLTLALLTNLVICSSIFFIQEFHLAVPDPYLIFFISFSLFNFYDFYKNYKKSSLYIFYISIGLGMLAKGPIAIALPGLIVGVFLLTQPQFKWKKIFNYKPFLGSFISIIISAPWYIMAHIKSNGTFTKGFFLNHNINRFGNAMEGHGGLFIVTWAFIILGLLPFSFFIIQALITSWKEKKKNDFLYFSFIVSVVFILFFSISNTKLPNYPMPSYPFIAILIAYYLYNILKKFFSTKFYKISLWSLTTIAFLMPIAGFIALTYIETQLKIVNYVSIALVLLFIGCLFALIFLYKKEIKQSILALGLMSVLLQISLFTWVYPKLTDLNPVIMAKNIISKDSKVILYKSFDPALLFNFKQTYPNLNEKDSVINFLKTNPDYFIITKKKYFESDWQNEKTTVLLDQKSLFENYSLIIFKYK